MQSVTADRASRGLGLRGRLILAFMAIALLLGLIGAAGIWFGRRQNVVVGQLIDVAAPLELRSAALVANAQRMRLVLLDSLSGSGRAADAEVAAALAALEATGAEGIAALRDLAERANLSLPISELVQQQREVARLMAAMAEAHSRDRLGASVTAQRLTAFGAARNAVEGMLHVIADRAEARMVEAEEQAKTGIQAGAATVDSMGTLFGQIMSETFPGLQGANRLLRETGQLQELADGFLAAAAGELPAVETATRTALRRQQAALRRLAGRLRSPEGRASVAEVTAGLARLEATLLAPDGLYAGQRARLAAQADREAARITLVEAEAELVRLLDQTGGTAGALERTARIAAEEGAQETLFGLGLIAALGTALAILLGLLAAAAITRPLGRLERAMRDLAEGKLETQVPELERRDEIGRMAAGVAVFREGLIERRELTAAQEAARDKAELVKRAALESLAERVETEARNAVDHIGVRMQGLIGDSQRMAGAVDLVAADSTAVDAAATAALNGAQAVAAATEQLSASIAEISRRAGAAREIARQAASRGEAGTATIRGLSESVGRIGEVSRLIADIASRTNLLALNATIEAARAGEAGKGFAVVASEVKQLAAQTARATDDIARQIQEVAAATSQAVNAVAEVGAAVGDLQGASADIAVAVEQQASATREIARAVAGASASVQEVSGLIGRVATAAAEAGGSVAGVRDGANDASAAVVELREVLVRVVRTATPDVDRRVHMRVTLSRPAVLESDGGRLEAELVDISAGGARLRAVAGLAVGAQGRLLVPSLGTPTLPFFVVSAGPEGDLRLRFYLPEETVQTLAGLLAALPEAASGEVAQAA